MNGAAMNGGAENVQTDIITGGQVWQGPQPVLIPTTTGFDADIERSGSDRTGSSLGSGNSHTPFDLPVLVAGRGGNALNTGRHVRLPMDTPLNNLWLTVLNAMNTPTRNFGNSTGRLPIES